jgi:hypothetical protein
VCAEALYELAPDKVRLSVERYKAKVGELGYPEMTRRYEVLRVG